MRLQHERVNLTRNGEAEAVLPSVDDLEGQISHFGAVQVRPGVSAFRWRSCLAVPGTRLAAVWAPS